MYALSIMRWNWQQPDWPNFQWKTDRLARAEARFLHGAGVLVGSTKHLDQSERDDLLVEAMSLEAVTTSEIEGEVLSRASVQSSIQKQLGLATDRKQIAPAEQGISELMVSLYRSIGEPLSEEMLFNWHRMVMSGRPDLKDLGRYRRSSEPMQVISGSDYKSKVHFEAPPSELVASEMERFIVWFNSTAPGGSNELPPLARAGIAHLYFESIHPFEDGNGRVGRAIAEKALVQGLGRTILIALAGSILAHHRDYYKALEAANKRNEVTGWLRWFAAISLEAQSRTLAEVEFIIHKAKLLDGVRGQLNQRQEKVLLRMLREGPGEFQGGLSASKYSTITGTSSATTTRDLLGLVELGVLIRRGEFKHTRYDLNMRVRKVSIFSIDDAGAVFEATREAQ